MSDKDHEHQWQDSGFADLEDCAVAGCRLVRSSVTGEIIDPTEKTSEAGGIEP